MPVPNIFGSATSAIPLSQLDTNFATPVTIGNTAVQLGNTVTSFGNVTLTNVTISSGNVTVSAGSNTAPSITTVGDTNTGIFFPAADTIAFSEGGVESMRIDSDGDVGIGTASPASKLTVSGDIQVLSTNYLNFTNTAQQTYLRAPASNTLVFGTNSTEAMRIDSSRNVGIGTDNPSHRLDVQAAQTTINATSTTGTNPVYLRLNNTGGYFFAGRDGSTGSSFGTPYASIVWSNGLYPMVFGTNDTERMRIDSNGNLLVGLTSQTSTAATFAVSGSKNNGNAARIGLISLGGSDNGSNYPQIGYNTVFTATSTINYLGNDTASWIRFSVGKVETFTAASGTAGNAISATTGPYVAQGDISWTNGSSDVRQKKNFETTQGLAEILQVEPIKYHFNWEDDTAPKKMGFKAQNLLPLIPEMVVEKDEKAEDGSPYLTITPDYMLPVLVKAIQEQQAIITSLTDRITALEAK